MGQAPNQNNPANLNKNQNVKGAQQGQFNQKNQQNVKGFDKDTKNLKGKGDSDAAEQEDNEDVTWGGDDADLESDIDQNRSSRPKNH